MTEVTRTPNANRKPLHNSIRASEHTPENNPVHTNARKRTRQKLTRDNPADDMFYIPVDEIPTDSSYEWKRFSVNGQEDPFYLAQMRRQGWEPVDPKRHPDWVPPGYSHPSIIRGGMILMERPIELTQEAYAEQKMLARNQIVEAEQRLGKTPRDTLTRDHPEIKPRVTKEYVRQIVAEE